MADNLNYLDPKSPLQKIAEKLDGEPTTQVDPDSLMQRIATSVENGAGGGSGGYSKKSEEMVIFNGAAKFLPTTGDVDILYQLYAPDSTDPDVPLDNFYDVWSGEYVTPEKLTLTGVPTELFGTDTIELVRDGQGSVGSVGYISYSAPAIEGDTYFSINSYLNENLSKLIVNIRFNSYRTEKYSVNLKLYGTSETVEVTKDFTDAVGVVTGYKIDTTEKALLDTYHVEEVPNNSSENA